MGFKNLINFLISVLAVLSLCGCAGFSLAVGSGGYCPVAACWLIAAASLAVEHGHSGTRASAFAARGLGSYSFQALEHRLDGCGTQAYLLHGMWDLPGSGIKPMSCALAGGFFTTEPPGKPSFFVF